MRRHPYVSSALRSGQSILVALLLLASVLLAAAPTVAQSVADQGKTVVLGFDGVDGDLTTQWMDEGELPNLAKLRDHGTFSPLMPTIPSQTPVSWSTFATGLDPGRHGVFDFLRRDPDTYRPQLGLINEGSEQLLWGERNPLMLGLFAGIALMLILFVILRPFGKERRKPVAIVVTLLLAAGSAYGVSRVVDAWVPDNLPTAENPRQGDTFWQLMGDAGVRVRVLRLPQNFPPKPFDNGQILTGLGTPDLSLRVGKPFYFTSELFFQAEGGGDFSLEMVELIDNKGEIPTEIKGPPNKLFPGDKLSYLTLPMTLNVLESEGKLRIRVGEEGKQIDIELAQGEWSDWEHFNFAYNPLISMAGIGRFHLISLEPEVRLYLSPIQFDPHNLPPSFHLSHPHEFAADLTEEHGYYKTIGWAVDTWSMDEGTIDEALFLDDVEQTASRYELMLQEQLAAPEDWDVLVHYFEFTDRVQHMMFRLFDPEHPRYDEELAAKYGGSILDAYKRMDEIVGGVMEKMPDANIVVVSDHGFSSWRWSMNYNTWLVKNGYMRLNGQDADRMNLEDLFDQGDFFVNVDWSQTRAYALGFGNIFINLEGRERDGIVPQEDYEALREEIRQGMLEYVHEESGLKPVAHVFFREEAYDSFDRRVMPDMIATNADYFRAGWQDTLGGIGSSIVEPNTKRWSGDHCSLYPPLVEGILFSNRDLNLGDGPYMGDIAPTLLSMYGVEPSVELDGKSLAP